MIQGSAPLEIPSWTKTILCDYSHLNVLIRVQAENKKISPSTFPKRLGPRIDLAAFFWPPGIAFTYHPGLLARLHKKWDKTTIT